MPSGLSVTGACRGPGVGGSAWGARGLVAGWVGQSGVLAPRGCDCGCSPWLRRHLSSTSDLGVNVKLYF